MITLRAALISILISDQGYSSGRKKALVVGILCCHGNEVSTISKKLQSKHCASIIETLCNKARTEADLIFETTWWKGSSKIQQGNKNYLICSKWCEPYIVRSYDWILRKMVQNNIHEGLLVDPRIGGWQLEQHKLLHMPFWILLAFP